MIKVTEKLYIKKINKIGFNYYEKQKRKRTTYWLFWIIPILVLDKVISGNYEN